MTPVRIATATSAKAILLMNFPYAADVASITEASPHNNQTMVLVYLRMVWQEDHQISCNF